ncbi:Mu transposase C-terminal domain-containing protein, partial [Microbacterium sp. CCH5-D1]|uniref:Mu transposase C-terminal domain-containing protein n=1 Tax=Microbacterium sp. CCH5-D1 TaxID=1768780 RepID=UPI000769F205
LDEGPVVGAWLVAVEAVLAAGPGKRKATIVEQAAALSVSLGKPVSGRTLERKLRAFQEMGKTGVADNRASDRRAPRRSSIDPRLVEVLNEVLAERSTSSTTNRTVIIDKLKRRVRERFGDDVVFPSAATLYRLLGAEDRGRFSFGSAKTRESLALQPDRAFGSRSVIRPGEHVQMDTTRMDVMVRVDEKTVARPELTILLDVATRSILGAVLRPEGTKSIDLLVVLARALVPYGRRLEGARETRALVSSAWAEDALISQERFDRLRMAQPFIFPETITTDRGKTYLSKHFRAACEALQISLITSAPHTPTDKPHVERTFKSIHSLFLQYAKGYVGRSVEHRGRDVEADSEEVLTITQMQELLEDWIAVEWQNHSHSSLRDPLHPSISLSPNEMCRAFHEVGPELHVPLTREDFIALLPVVYRGVNRYGVSFQRRVYDSQGLHAFRRRLSPLKQKQGKWPIRFDPYNVHVVWLEVDGEFIALRWANDLHEVPMLGDVWRQARMEYRCRDASVDRERDELAAAMRAFIAKGNTKTARRRARVAVAADDPMHLSAGVAVGTEVGAASVEDRREHRDDGVTGEPEWPNRGGFSYTTDLDATRKRADDV